MTTLNPRKYCRPFTSIVIKNPTYPTILQMNGETEIVQMTWEERRETKPRTQVFRVPLPILRQESLMWTATLIFGITSVGMLCVYFNSERTNYAALGLSVILLLVALDCLWFQVSYWWLKYQDRKSKH